LLLLLLCSILYLYVEPRNITKLAPVQSGKKQRQGKCRVQGKTSAKYYNYTQLKRTVHIRAEKWDYKFSRTRV